MENFSLKEVPPKASESKDLNDEESAVNFQKFIYDLFEKKGVLNDLRASLRGHIVEVLKSAQTGEPPTCQKHFTQRLELTYQAINILIAEYFLRLEFGYSLSVFVSEIPLSNMVFDFAKNLMENKDTENIKFKERDVWSILNYLGVKCDSNCASNILHMYCKENVPLLLCILNCMSLYRRDSACLGQGNVSSNSPSSSVKSLDSSEADKNIKNASKIASAHDQCHHFDFCKTCQAKMKRMKERYRSSKKKHLVKSMRSWNKNPQNVKILMRNVEDVEECLVDEMFQQLKDVYEAEVDMMKQNEEKAIKRSLASHALQLQKRREEMEESFKEREAQLERNVREKKEFLWGLARALREQHAQMSRAMHAVRCETDRLTAKENSLKSQLIDAENVLKKRGEEMRKQISDELIILEGHLESMKRERDKINRERQELEQIKTACDTNSQVIKVHDLTNDELRSHYDLLKDELGILKKYLETTKLEPKCVIERSTITEMSNVTSKINLVLNNEQDLDRSPSKVESDERARNPNKVVNDLKKPKNVNFCTSNTDELYRDRSRSSASSEAGDAAAREAARDRDLVARLREENERLKTFARQQREHIDELTSHGARLRAELTSARLQTTRPPPSRPRTAPATAVPPTFTQSLNASVSTNAVGWRKGAGEEISIFSNAQPRILLPGDAVPFVGVLRDRQADGKRHLISQWRALRRGGGNNKAPIASPALKTSTPQKYENPVRTSKVSTSRGDPEDEEPYSRANFAYQPVARERAKVQIDETHPPRAKSPKSVLKEAKEKLIKYNYTREQPCSSRDSPTSVLREARNRLRKLEIEAEAVEKSYLDFRRRQEEMKQKREHYTEDFKTRDMSEKLEDRIESEQHTSLNKTPLVSAEFDRYQTIVDTLTNFKNRNTGLSNSRPIPIAYSKLDSELKDSQQRHNYYLETPLEEFRKLYNSQRSPVKSERSIGNKSNAGQKELHTPVINEDNFFKDTMEQRPKSPKRPKTKDDELEILKDNINKMYNINTNEFQNRIAPIEESIDNIGNAIEEIINNDEVINNDEIVNNDEIINNDKIINNDEIIDNDELKDEVEAVTIDEEKNASFKDEPNRELLLVVESTVDTKEIDISETEDSHEKISTQMTIIVSPKMDLNDVAVIESNNDKRERSISPEQAAKLTRNDALNAIFHADPEKVFSSGETELDISKREDSVSDVVKGCDDYPDDFSADVDNYNSRSDYEVNSPISLPKSSEDDNFWDT